METIAQTAIAPLSRYRRAPSSTGTTSRTHITSLPVTSRAVASASTRAASAEISTSESTACRLGVGERSAAREMRLISPAVAASRSPTTGPDAGRVGSPGAGR